MPKKSYDEFLIDMLKDPHEAEAYLNEAFKECRSGDPESQELLLIALKNVAIAQGGLSELSTKTGLGRESLYKSLSKKGNPKLTTLTTLINAMGFEIKITIPKR
ncbi:putative addiction module antidote protein [candidate division TM6 bacterium RIFCSPHIGHO2_12_FULL_32_22]|nr:MAG: putative addiction module antidote protein [candidate division TM6 bacterium RIFCSPHIGHO2_12_FULL_32_22]